MTETDINDLENVCAGISDNMRTVFPNFNLFFLIGPAEKKPTLVTSVLTKISGHPALNEAFLILKNWTSSPKKSAFLGLSEGQDDMLFSFKSVPEPKTLGFIAIDTSLYNELTQALHDVYALTAIFLSTYSNHLKNPIHQNGNIFANTSSQIASARLHLKADIYSTLQLIKDGQYDAAGRLAKQRSLETLSPQPHITPEEFPFPIALDIINYTIEKQLSSTISKYSTDPILSQYQLAEQITACFNIENLQSWLQFANCSQTMAWIGFTPSQILGAAINTSTNPFIKAIGHILAELTNLAPTEESHLPNGYNPFVAEEINKIRHERMIEETCEMVLMHAIEAESHIPLIRVANNQNDALLKGKIFGWCAAALQAAAKAYIGAKDRGIPPIQAARLEFQSVYLQSDWKLLQQLGQDVIENCRHGKEMTMDHLVKWSTDRIETRFLSESLALTLSDSNYIARTQKPEQALHKNHPQPSSSASPSAPLSPPAPNTQTFSFESDHTT